MKKILFSILTTCLLLLFIFPSKVEAATFKSGTLGSNAKWTLSDTGTLTITGNGTLMQEDMPDDYPWYPYKWYVRKVVIGDGITNIPASAFAYHDLLTEVVLPDSLKIIDNAAFQKSGITTLDIPNSVTTIGEYAFSSSALTNISIPGVKTIESYSFGTCKDLKTVTLNKGTVKIRPYAFAHCESLTTVKFPSTLTTIETGAFRYCTSLTTINLPNKLETLEERALEGCPFKSVTLPASLKTLDKTFNDCSSLKTLRFTGDFPDSIHPSEFGGLTLDIYYPAENHTWSNDKLLNYGGEVNWFEEGILTIKTQPKGKAFANGATASAKVTAVGDGLKYQWYYKNPGSASFKKSSVTAAKYFCTMKPATSGRQIYCIIKDAAGKSIKTKTVTLSMIDITKQPTDKQVSLGKKIKTNFVAEGDALTYQWYYKNKFSDSFSISSVQTSSYAYKMTPEKSERKVYCLITDKYGNTRKTDTAILSASASIVIQPTDDKDLNGNGVSAYVNACGVKLKYQWYYKNKGNTKFSKSSETYAHYNVKMTSKVDGRELYCVVTDQFGNSVKTNIITFTMAKPVSISTQPTSKQGPLNKTIKTKVIAKGDGLNYQWYVKDKGSDSFVKSSIKSATYSYKMTTQKSGRKVYCVITDQYGCKVQSQTVTLSASASITEQPIDVSAKSGEQVTTSVKAFGSGLTYQWYYRNSGNTKFSKSSLTSDTYYVNMSKKVNGREVYCVITDKFGNSVTSDTVTLTLIR